MTCKYIMGNKCHFYTAQCYASLVYAVVVCVCVYVLVSICHKLVLYQNGTRRVPWLPRKDPGKIPTGSPQRGPNMYIKICNSGPVSHSTAFNTVLYGCETWTYNKKDQTQTAGIWHVLLPKNLRISWTEWKTNRAICDKLIIEKDLVQRAIQRKLQLFGHISRMEDNRKLKTLMFGIVDRTNKRGRPCRELMDDTISWCKTGLQELNSLA